MKFVVAGGGVAGLAASLALARPRAMTSTEVVIPATTFAISR